MRSAALAGVLLASLASAPAWASTPAQDSVRRLAAIVRSSAPGSPLLSGRLASLLDGLKSLVGEKSVSAAAAKPVENETAALLSGIKRGDRPAADQVLKIADDAESLLHAGASPGSAPRFLTGAPPSESAALAALQKRSATMAAIMSSPDFDGAPSAAPALASVPLPRPRELARPIKPVFSAQTEYYQGALNPFLKSSRRRPIATDGIPGGTTEKAVAFFQNKKGLPETGVVDRATEAALLSDFQARRKLPVTGALDEKTAKALRSRRMAAASAAPVYFEGSQADFEPKAGAQTIKNVFTTVYTPFLAKTRKQRRLEGPPIDHHDQTVCTLERYLAGVCPYVSVAMDPRLDVPNGTPLLIPEISQMAGKTVHFRIVDTGSKKRFKGTGHVDVATDSNQYSGYGQLISGKRFTLVLPEGLHPSEL